MPLPKVETVHQTEDRMVEPTPMRGGVVSAEGVRVPTVDPEDVRRRGQAAAEELFTRRASLNGR